MAKSVGGGGRDWAQIYAIYGSDEWHSVAFLIFNSFLFAILSILLLFYFNYILTHFHLYLFPTLHLSILRFSLALSGSFLVLSSVCFLIAAANVLYSSSALRWEIGQRMLSAVPDWSSVRTALDVGCGRGILLNSVAIRLKQSGGRGRVVGLDSSRAAVVDALRRAVAEGVQEYVTCRQGDARRLPFADGFFDVVVSAIHLSGIAKAAEERGRGLGEIARVIRPGGVGVIWDVNCAPEFAQRLGEMGMEDIRLSETVTAFMVGSHIVSFRKPIDAVETAEADWRTDIC